MNNLTDQIVRKVACYELLKESHERLLKTTIEQKEETIRLINALLELIPDRRVEAEDAIVKLEESLIEAKESLAWVEQKSKAIASGKC